jgi:hypothetical protein
VSTLSGCSAEEKAAILAHYSPMAAQAVADALPPIPDMPSDSPLWRAVIEYGDQSYSANSRALLDAAVAAVEAAVADMMRDYALQALAMRRGS